MTPVADKVLTPPAPAARCHGSSARRGRTL